MNKSIPLLVLGLCASGCEVKYQRPEVPSRVEYEFEHAPNGKPLRFEAKDSVVTVREKFPVGERQIFSSSGRYVGKEIIYDSRTVERPYHEWHVYQGKKRIDAMSALYIARDKAFMDAYARERVRVEGNHRLAMEMYETEVVAVQSKKNMGTALVAVGTAGAIISGLFAGIMQKEQAPAVPPVALSVAAVGFLGVSLGGFLIRSSADTQQLTAMPKINHLARSRIENGSMLRLGTEEHVQAAVEARWPPKEPEPPKQEAAPPAESEEPASMDMLQVNVTKALKPMVDASIANNKKLAQALLAIWNPKQFNTTAEEARTKFEQEFVRSKLYWNDQKGKIGLHQGNLVVYTDEASLLKAEGKGANPKTISAVELLSMTLVIGRGIYVHYEGDGSAFTVIEPERIVKLLEIATRPLVK